MSYYEKVIEAKNYLSGFITKTPTLAITAGSGLGGLAENMTDKIIIDADKIPNWPVSTAPGHAGKVIAGKFFNREVILLQGRVHYYEGYSLKEVTFPVRVLAMLGVKKYLATNASGAINPNFKSGDIIAINDHINLMGDNPLRGNEDFSWNEHFPDMTYAYSPAFLKIFSELNLKQGVYAAFSGPSFETPAEIRMAKILGADLAGMSTVPEIIIANSMGLETGALSCVANMAAGIEGRKLSGEEVLEIMRDNASKLENIICEFIKKLGE